MAFVSDIAAPPDYDATAVVLAADVGLSPEMPLIPPAAAPDTANWARCVAVAALLHASVLGVLNWPVSDNALGSGGTDLEAISVDVVQASALQSMAASANDALTPAAAPLAVQQGADRQQAAAAEAPDHQAEKQPAAAAKAETADLVIPDVVVKPEPQMPDVPQIVIATAKAEHKIEAPQTPAEVKAPPGLAVAEVASAPAEAAPAENLGGMLSSGAAVAEMAAQSAAIALTGDLAAYARQVQQAVARNPPRVLRGGGGRGDVVITFALGLDGTLLRAQVLLSSGNASLDEAALATVRSATFPAPPAGSQPSQLVYRFPVKFR